MFKSVQQLLLSPVTASLLLCLIVTMLLLRRLGRKTKVVTEGKKSGTASADNGSLGCPSPPPHPEETAVAIATTTAAAKCCCGATEPHDPRRTNLEARPWPQEEEDTYYPQYTAAAATAVIPAHPRLLDPLVMSKTSNHPFQSHINTLRAATEAVYARFSTGQHVTERQVVMSLLRNLHGEIGVLNDKLRWYMPEGRTETLKEYLERMQAFFIGSNGPWAAEDFDPYHFSDSGEWDGDEDDYEGRTAEEEDVSERRTSVGGCMRTTFAWYRANMPKVSAKDGVKSWLQGCPSPERFFPLDVDEKVEWDEPPEQPYTFPTPSPEGDHNDEEEDIDDGEQEGSEYDCSVRRQYSGGRNPQCSIPPDEDWDRRWNVDILREDLEFCLNPLYDSIPRFRSPASSVSDM